MRRHRSISLLHMVPGLTESGKTIRTNQVPIRHAERSINTDIPVQHLFTGRGCASEHA